jgi:hypothetical protein
MIKKEIDIIIPILKKYITDTLNSWSLSKDEKTLVGFESQHMPYNRYSGNQSVDHILFRKFLRCYDPQNIEDSIAGNVINIYKERIEELEKENEELRKELAEHKKLIYAAL